MNEDFEIGTAHGVTPCDDEEGGVGFLDLIDETEGFRGVEFERMTLLYRGGSAVAAGQCAGSCRFPDDDEGAVVEVERT